MFAPFRALAVTIQPDYVQATHTHIHTHLAALAGSSLQQSSFDAFPAIQPSKAVEEVAPAKLCNQVAFDFTVSAQKSWLGLSLQISVVGVRKT